MTEQTLAFLLGATIFGVSAAWVHKTHWDEMERILLFVSGACLFAALQIQTTGDFRIFATTIWGLSVPVGVVDGRAIGMGLAGVLAIVILFLGLGVYHAFPF